MSRGTWDDFTTTSGFNDGASTEERDSRARDTLCEFLNDHHAIKEAGVRAVPFDRPGLHNGCLILVLKDEPGWSHAEVLARWSGDKATVLPLPELERGELRELIDLAYDLVDTRRES